MNRKLKIKNHQIRNKASCGLPDMKAWSLFCCLVLVSFLFMYGCATGKGGGQQDLSAVETPVVTGIDITGSTIRISADKPFIYTIYKPGDPYKLVIDLPGVNLGTFTGKIVLNKEGITEIVPSQEQPPAMMAKLEVLLQNPSSAEQEYKDNVLTIRLKTDEMQLAEPGDFNARPNLVQAVASERRPGVSVRSVAEEDEQSLVDRMRARARGGQQNATEISDISFEKTDTGVKVLIKGNGSMTPSVFPIDDRIVIDIADVKMNAQIPSVVMSPVRAIRAGERDSSLRLVLDLFAQTNFDVTAVGDSIEVDLSAPEIATATVRVPAGTSFEEPAPAPAYKADAFEDFDEGRCQAYLQGREKVSLDFQDQDIMPILRLFAKISGCNIFIHPDVRGKATMDFRDVPWNQALETILKTFSLDSRVEGNIIRVAPHTVFAKESDDKAKAAAADVQAEALETKIFPISYAEVAVVESSLRSAKILSPRGSVTVDKRTSSLIVKDVPSIFPEIDNLLATLDRPTPQVLIEARIVEVNTSSAQDLGIQWGINYQASNTLASLGGLSGAPQTAPGPITGGNYLVDYPATSAGPLSGSGITFGIIDPSRTVGLDLQLSAIETMGKGKVISNPKILTVDNGQAKILQGKSIPVRKLTTEGTVSTEFKDVTLELVVVPHITPDGSIAMKVDIVKEELDPSIPSVEGVPGTDKKEANTNVIIKNGETVVIGGMYKITTSENESGVPGLMNIPVLGWLFKNKKDDITTAELLIFVTPRIVEKP